MASGTMMRPLMALLRAVVALLFGGLVLAPSSARAQLWDSLDFKPYYPTIEDAKSSGPGHPWQGSGGGVNLYSLAKETSIPLLGYRTLGGMPIGFSLFHNSQAFYHNPALGDKWMHSYDTQLRIWNEGGLRRAAVVWGDHRMQMAELSGGVWKSLDGYRDTLTKVGANYELLLHNQVKLVFEPSTSIPNLAPSKYRLLTITDRNIANTATCGYDAGGRLITVGEPSGRSLNLVYAAGKLASVEFRVQSVPLRVWQMTYDGQGRLASVILPTVTTDSGPQSYQYQFAYDPSSNIASILDPELKLWSFGYSGDRLSYAQWPNNNVNTRCQYAYVSNTLRTLTNPRGYSSTYEYDSQGRLVRYRNESFFDVFIELNDADFPWAPSKVTAPLGEQVKCDYDANGNLVGATDPAGNRWDYAYDSRNNLIQSLEPLVTDAWGNVEAAPHKTEYVYDANNNRIQRKAYYNANNFYLTAFQFDANSQMVSCTNPLNKTWTYQYDTYGNLRKMTTPMGRSVTMFYDTAALTAGFTVPNAWADSTGLRTELNRDEWGRMRKEDFLIEPDRMYSYDGMSRLVRMQDSTGISNFAYNGNGWLIHADKGPWFQNNSYLPNGLRSAMQEDSGTGMRTIAYDYEPRNLLEKITDGLGPTQYTYDSDGRLVAKTLPQNAVSMYSYANGLLQGLTQKDGGGNTMLAITYAYQANEMLAQTNDNGNITRTGYDFLGHLNREERNANPAYTFAWQYDPAGNRMLQIANGLNTSYQYDQDNLLVQAIPQGMAAEQYQNDANGRLVQRVRNNNAEIFQFQYNTSGDLTNMLQWNGANFVPYRNYAYDGMGRRIRRDNFNANEVDFFFHDSNMGSLVRTDYSVNGNPGVFLTTWGMGLVHAADVLAGRDLFAATDGMGDMRRYTNGFGQDSGYKSVFNRFGETMSTSGSPSVYRWGADRGVLTEGDAGLLAYHGRGIWEIYPDTLRHSFYDPKTGRGMASGVCTPDLRPRFYAQSNPDFGSSFTTEDVPIRSDGLRLGAQFYTDPWAWTGTDGWVPMPIDPIIAPIQPPPTLLDPGSEPLLRLTTFGSSPTGTMTIRTLQIGEGGTFDSFLPVQPVFTFSSLTISGQGAGDPIPTESLSF